MLFDENCLVRDYFFNINNHFFFIHRQKTLIAIYN